jgi:subtilisin-like proprotein convertase family protein
MNSLRLFARQIVPATVMIVGLAFAGPARAGLFQFGSGAGMLNQYIPDGPAGGVAYSFRFEETGQQISSIIVTLSISGGYNGDLYASLSHGSAYAVLLNRVGGSAGNPYGSGGSGFEITLSMGLLNDIHNASGTPGQPIAGSYFSADGRVNYTDTGRDTAHTLDAFNLVDPQGTWTLFFADLSPGSVSTLNGWSVEITTVPEPVNLALGFLGGIFGLVRLGRNRRVRELFRRR